VKRLLWLAACLSFAADDAGKILRPADRSSIAKGPVDVVATVPAGGRIELDGAPLKLDTPFPNVYHGKIDVAAGEHKLTIFWEDQRRQVTFAVGPREGFTPFRQHPPLADVACTQCHELSKRGRFRFKGGCEDCHAPAAFTKSHTPHKAENLAECGMCHNAHGSTVKGHMLRSRELSCKLCHN
jgi:hypothetical protein